MVTFGGLFAGPLPYHTAWSQQLSPWNLDTRLHCLLNVLSFMPTKHVPGDWQDLLAWEVVACPPLGPQLYYSLCANPGDTLQKWLFSNRELHVTIMVSDVLFVFEIRFHCIALDNFKLTMCRPGWLGTLGCPPASAISGIINMCDHIWRRITFQKYFWAWDVADLVKCLKDLSWIPGTQVAKN